jgi:hypothetical protein
MSPQQAAQQLALVRVQAQRLLSRTGAFDIEEHAELTQLVERLTALERSVEARTQLIEQDRLLAQRMDDDAARERASALSAAQRDLLSQFTKRGFLFTREARGENVGAALRDLACERLVETSGQGLLWMATPLGRRLAQSL